LNHETLDDLSNLGLTVGSPWKNTFLGDNSGTNVAHMWPKWRL